MIAWLIENALYVLTIVLGLVCVAVYWHIKRDKSVPQEYKGYE